MCNVSVGGDASDNDDEQKADMKMEYSASRDPSKLGEGNKCEDGGFKVGGTDHEKQIIEGK